MINLTEEMNKFRDENKIQYVASTSFSLPIYLRVSAKHYYYVIKDNIFSRLQHRERRTVVSINNQWNKSQSTTIRHSTVSYSLNGEKPSSYDFLSSSMIIMVELFEDEIEIVKSNFRKDREGFSTEFIQANLEYFFYNYNISTRGIHIVDPTVYDCNPISCFISGGNYHEAKSSDSLIIPGLGGYMKIPDNRLFERELENDSFNVGRYFYSEAKYSNMIGDHFKCIVYSAITIETLVMDIIVSNRLKGKGYLRNARGGNYLSMYKKLKKLIKNGYVVVNDENRFINSITSLLNNRHEIMHGNLDGLLNMKTVSDNNIKYLEEVYDDLIKAIRTSY